MSRKKRKSNGEIAVSLPLEFDGQRVFSEGRVGRRKARARCKSHRRFQANQALPKPRETYYICINGLSNSNDEYRPMQITPCSRALYVLMGQWHREPSVQ